MIFNGRHKEDKYIYENLFYKVEKGTFIEIGAGDGIISSNSLFFEKNLNWNGILIEANPTFYKNLKKNRPNQHIFDCLVSDSKIKLKFNLMDGTCGLCSGVDKTLAKEHKDAFFYNKNWGEKSNKRQELMKPRTMQSILDEVGILQIDFFSLDVEGHELNVLKSIDFSKTKINVILIEMLEVDKDLNERRIFLKNNNYIFFGKVGRNEVYILSDFISSISHK